MKKVRDLLKELEFIPTSDPRKGSRVLMLGPGHLIEPKEMGQEVFKKDRVPSFIMPNVFLCIIVISEKHVFIQVCQMITGKHLKEDGRLSDGGLVWFQEIFENEDEACAFIMKANESHLGPLYGNLMPPPTPVPTQ